MTLKATGKNGYHNLNVRNVTKSKIDTFQYCLKRSLCCRDISPPADLIG